MDRVKTCERVCGRLRVGAGAPTFGAPTHQGARSHREIRVRNRLLVSLVLLAVRADAGEPEPWARLWGPEGTGAAVAARALPASLRVHEVWRRPLGSGFSALSVDGARAYTGVSEGASDFLEALDLAGGRTLWRARLGDTYRGHDGSKDGPLSTPTVDGGRVFIVGPRGVLLAADAATGRELWRLDLATDLAAPAPFYGFATSPLVVGDRVIVSVGGEAHNLSAFDAATGKRLWSVAHAKGSGYGSPVRATIAGEPQVLVLAGDLVYGVRAADGALRWSHPTGWGGESSRPPVVLPGDRVLLPGDEESKLLQVKASGGTMTASPLWTSPRLKGGFSPTVFHDGRLFGMNGAYLVCLDPATGEAVWRHKVYAGSLILVDGHAVILGESSGDLRIGRLTPRGFEERLTRPVFNAGAASYTGPSFAGTRFYLRNVEEAVALELEG
jgi:outer membrane protein assembly factor BamB